MEWMVKTKREKWYRFNEGYLNNFFYNMGVGNKLLSAASKTVVSLGIFLLNPHRIIKSGIPISEMWMHFKMSILEYKKKMLCFKFNGCKKKTPISIGLNVSFYIRKKAI